MGSQFSHRFWTLAVLAAALVSGCSSPDPISPVDAPTDTGSTCEPDQGECGGQCVEIMSDPQNCGGCGVVCGTDATCTGGQCVCDPRPGARDPANFAPHTIARQWNELHLAAVRRDLARPTHHARTLYHVAAAMWDAWAAYDPVAGQVLHREKLALAAVDVAAARDVTISYAAYRILRWRFRNSPGAATTLVALDGKMSSLGYDRSYVTQTDPTPASLGNRIAATVIATGLADGSNEANGYASTSYAPINEPLIPTLSGNPSCTDPNRWQSLSLAFFVDQGGNPIPTGYPPALSHEWGKVTPFSMADMPYEETVRDGFTYRAYLDQGPPPTIDDPKYKAGFAQVLDWSGKLDPTTGVMADISPNARGNNTLGTNDGTGHRVNPTTCQPYAPQVVPEGDYYRVLAEFWADGPNSETPPGHWFSILNYVSDRLLEKKFEGQTAMGDLEWNVKTYLVMGGALHDAAIAAWGAKGKYDYTRPVMAIRYMCDRGQSTDPNLPSYHVNGIPLSPGKIELITAASTQAGGVHAALGTENIGKIAVKAWRGPGAITNPATDTAGVGWQLCGNWWPYQRPTFVTPPFAGYVSGHSTFSRAAAEVMTLLTNDPYFPGGVGKFVAPKNQYLVFEEGPSVDVTLEWATYRDAADECSLSRIYGGIHPTQDDIPGRKIGAMIGPHALGHAKQFFSGQLGTN
ncbi:MAG: hypothetical protein JWP01_2800 [Myxococcales bacterium]|nr:hypothetical protein [Myxococcales bacterium]